MSFIPKRGMAITHSLFFLFLMLFSMSSAEAQVGRDPLFNDDDEVEEQDGADTLPPEEDSGAPLPQDSAADTSDPDDEVNAEKELLLSSNELREKFTNAITLNIGSTRFREVVAFSYYYLHTKDLLFSGNIGAGNWIMDGEQVKKTYRIRSNMKNVGLGARYYFTDVTDFYTEANLTYLFWKGTVEPTGTNSDDEEEDVSDKLKSSFSVGGPAVGLKLGWSANWENGLFVDFCLFGAAKSWLVSEAYTKSATESKNAVRRELQTAQIWGLVNFGIGMLF